MKRKASKLTQRAKLNAKAQEIAITNSFRDIDEDIESDSDEQELSQTNLLALDPISSFSTQETLSSQKKQKTRDDAALLREIESMDDDDDYEEQEGQDEIIDTEDLDDLLHSPIHEFVEPLTKGFEPHFTNIPNQQPTVPMPKPPEFLRRRVKKEGKKTIEFKKGGIAERALAAIVHEKDEFDEWERGVNAMMAKYGSIVEVCSRSPESTLFRLIDPWLERGLVFAWCVPVKRTEIEMVLGDRTPVGSQTWDHREDDIIEDFSQPKSLPPYVPSEEDERLLMAFSFAYVTTAVSKEEFVEKEKCVGVWPHWTEMDTMIDDVYQKVYLVTRFKSDMIY